MGLTRGLELAQTRMVTRSASGNRQKRENLPAVPDEINICQPGSVLEDAAADQAPRVCGSAALRYGLPCPFCKVGKVDYDSLLNLVCRNCEKTQTGVFT